MSGPKHTAPDWDCVRLGDGITASGRVCEIHECDDGRTVFVVRDAKLVEHRPAPRPKLYAFTQATVTASTWIVQTIKGGVS